MKEISFFSSSGYSNQMECWYTASPPTIVITISEHKRTTYLETD